MNSRMAMPASGGSTSDGHGQMDSDVLAYCSQFYQRLPVMSRMAMFQREVRR